MHVLDFKNVLNYVVTLARNIDTIVLCKLHQGFALHVAVVANKRVIMEVINSILVQGN